MGIARPINSFEVLTVEGKQQDDDGEELIYAGNDVQTNGGMAQEDIIAFLYALNDMNNADATSDAFIDSLTEEQDQLREERLLQCGEHYLE